MKRHYALLLLVMLSLLLLIVWRETRPHSDLQLRVFQDETQTIKLSSAPHPQQLVYEDARIRIHISYTDYLKYTEELLLEGLPHSSSAIQEAMEEDPALRTQIAQSINARREEVGDTFRNNSYYLLDAHDDTRLIANMLASGRAYVYDKRLKRSISIIRMRTYEYVCGGMCAAGYRYFYIPAGKTFIAPDGELLFFEIQDWQS